jgi:CHAD domain-containing protein
MPRLQKWLNEVGPEAPVPRAARKALRSRLVAVQRLLHQAVRVSRNQREDVEAIHQLRTWTRRAAAALRLLAEVLPRRSARWLKRKLRKVRRTAGEARDCDVLAERLKDAAVRAKAHLRTERKRAAKELLVLYKSLFKSGRFQRKCKRLLDRIRWCGAAKGKSSQPQFGTWCKLQLVQLADAFLALGNRDVSQNANLHQLRIAGKRLRYALELAPAALAKAIHRRLYDELSEVQERLGEVCDHIAAAARLKDWQTQVGELPLRRQLGVLLARERRQLASSKRRFLKWWTAARRHSLRRAWSSALSQRGAC